MTTLFPLIALLLFGGPTIKNFVLALAVGVLTGTYSSIFNASPILVAWREKKKRKSLAAKELAFGAAGASGGTAPIGAKIEVEESLEAFEAKGPAAPKPPTPKPSYGPGKTTQKKKKKKRKR